MKILLSSLNSKYVHTNLAIRYIRSYCSGFDITLKEYTINDPLQSIISDISASGTHVIGFSCYIWNIESTLKVCSSLKRINKEITIILGGPEVSFDYIKLMESHEYIDYIVKGEGEIPSKHLFAYLSGDGSSIGEVPGIVFREGKSIIENPEPDLINNLDMIPFPYNMEESLEKKIVYYESSRGCPFNCSYCLSSTLRGVRFLPLERVKKELLWFIDNNVELVKFIDRTFNCNKQAIEIFRFLVDHRKNTRFHFEICADILDKKMIDFLNGAPEGLFQFEIGVQSTNEYTLEFVNRKTDLIKVTENVRALRRPGNIHLHLDLIAGLPGETYSSFAGSFNDVFALKPHMLQLGFLKLLKGSKIRKDAEGYGIVFTEYPPYEVLKTDVLSFQELSFIKNIEDVVDRYYNSERFNVTLKYILEIIKDPFKMFADICKYEESEGLRGKSIGNTGHYKLLYDFCTRWGWGDISILKECLAFDYLMQGRNPVVPDFLVSVMKTDKQFLWDFFSREENIKKYLPNYLGESKKNIIKSIHMRFFSFDICSYIKDGSISIRPKHVVFDYCYTGKKVRYFCI